MEAGSAPGPVGTGAENPMGFDPQTVQTVASRYTDWAIPAYKRTCMIHKRCHGEQPNKAAMKPEDKNIQNGFRILWNAERMPAHKQGFCFMERVKYRIAFITSHVSVKQQADTVATRCSTEARIP
jgi:hypothetical protein